MTTKELKTLSFDSGQTVYQVVDTVARTTKLDIAQSITVLATTGTISLADNSINTITPTGNIAFTLPTVTDNTVFHQILVQLNLSTVYTIDMGTTYFFNKTAPDLSNIGVYNLIFEYDKANGYWVAGIIEKGAES